VRHLENLFLSESVFELCVEWEVVEMGIGHMWWKGRKYVMGILTISALARGAAVVEVGKMLKMMRQFNCDFLKIQNLVDLVVRKNHGFAR